MSRKIIAYLGVILVLFVFHSCSSSPEQGLLKSYFQAMSLNDLTTMSTMAMEPISVDLDSWELYAVGEETVEPVKLGEMNAAEIELKKNVEESVGITLDAKDELDDAKYELEQARTGAARNAIQRKVDEAQKKYDEIYENHKNLQKDYNDAQAAASKEEEITLFSLSARGDDFPTVREATGNVHRKHVDVRIVTQEGDTGDYRVFLRRYLVKDPTLNIDHRGRWIITKFERKS